MLAKNEEIKAPARLSIASKKVILTILYHEVFSYPLTLGEIKQRINITDLTTAQLKEAVKHLVDLDMLHKVEDYYSVKKRPDWVKSRKAANQLSRKVEARALRRAELISKFPFIRGVFFSGTFAKGLMMTDSDIDFFIITSRDRLWLARTLLILYKKIFLFNSRKFFCVNYFIDEEHLLIEEQNLFTATEITTLRPAFGRKVYLAFRKKNSWVTKYYPNIETRENFAVELKNTTLKGWLEKRFSGSFGSGLDYFFYKKTLQFWRRKFDWMDDETFKVALKSKSHVSKHHPNNFQDRVLRKYHYAIEEFEKLHNVRVHLLDVA